MYTNHKRCILLKWELCWFLCVFTNEIDRFDSFRGKKIYVTNTRQWWITEILMRNSWLQSTIESLFSNKHSKCCAEQKNAFYFVRYDCGKVINISSALSCYEKKVCQKKRQQTNCPIQIPSKTVFVFIPAWNQPNDIASNWMSMKWHKFEIPSRN